MIYQATEVFWENKDSILAGSFDSSLISLTKSIATLQRMKNISAGKIYTYRPVLQTEAAGFQVLPGLLEIFFNAIMYPDKASSQKVKSLLPKECLFDIKEQQYESILNITSYVAGMTDTYAIDTYRNLKGIQLPNF